MVHIAERSETASAAYVLIAGYRRSNWQSGPDCTETMLARSSGENGTLA